ncbi:MAG: hypothetical protein V4721_09345 [Bacteroidota bacterium]
MKKFLTRLAVFLLPIFILIYPADLLISNFLAKSNNYGEGEVKVWEDIYTGNINSDLLIYGSSRAWVHINPQIIEDSLHMSSYNLGIDGHNFGLQYLRHKELIKNNKKPAYILLSLDIFSLQNNTGLYNFQQFLPFLLWNKNIYQYTSSYKGFTFYDYNVPMLRYLYNTSALLAALKSFTNVRNTSVRNKGYMGMEYTWNLDLDNAKAQFNAYEVKFDPALTRLLDQFIQECNASNIKLILLYTPEYIEGQAFVKNRAEMILKYKQLAEKYKLQFLDYSGDELSMQKDFFYNAQHLNKKGSEIFTNKLVKDLKLLIHKGQ